ncbi:MAG: alpha/beta hydrolase, partial [Rubrobacteraceae bacterium]
MSEKIERTKVSFDSGGVRLVGYLHRPADATGRLPGVVMGHGFSGTQDRLFDAAERFAAAGLAALTFDYRSFGESGGEPRQVVNVSEQLKDWRAAIRFARGLKGVDAERVALWGSSLGGGHVVSVAADDPRIAAVVAQIPFNGFPRRVEGRSTLDTLKVLWAMSVDAARGRLGLSPRYIPMVGAPGEVAVTATAQAHEHIATLAGETDDSPWRNEVAPRGLFGMMLYRPGEVAQRLAMPVLVCIAEDDRETPEETTRQIAERAPRGELRRYPGTHFDFYRDPVRQQVMTDQIAFLHTHLTEDTTTHDLQRKERPMTTPLT